MSPKGTIKALQEWDELCQLFVRKKSEAEKDEVKVSGLISDLEQRQQTAVDTLSAQITKMKSSIGTIDNIHFAKNELDDLSSAISEETDAFRQNLQLYEREATQAVQSQIDRSIERSLVIEAVDAQVRDMERMIEQYEGELRGVTISVNDIQSNVETAKAEVERLNEMNSNLDNSALDLPTISDNIVTLEEKLVKARQVNTSLMDINHSIDESASELRDGIDKLKKTRGELMEKYNHQIRSLMAAISVSSTDESGINDLIIAATDGTSPTHVFECGPEYGKRLYEAMEYVRGLDKSSIDRVARMVESVNEINSKIEDCDNDIQRLESDIAVVEKEIVQVRCDLNIADESISNLNSIIENLENERDEISGRVQCYKTKMDKLDQTWRHRQILTRQLRDQVDRYTKEIADYDCDIADLNNKITVDTATMDMYDAARAQLTATHSMTSDKMRMIGMLQEERRTIEEDIRTTQENNTKITQRITALVSNCQEVTGSYETLTKEKKELLSQILAYERQAEEEVRELECKNKQEVDNIIRDIKAVVGKRAGDVDLSLDKGLTVSDTDDEMENQRKDSLTSQDITYVDRFKITSDINMSPRSVIGTDDLTIQEPDFPDGMVKSKQIDTPRVSGPTDIGRSHVQPPKKSSKAGSKATSAAPKSDSIKAKSKNRASTSVCRRKTDSSNSKSGGRPSRRISVSPIESTVSTGSMFSQDILVDERKRGKMKNILPLSSYTDDKVTKRVANSRILKTVSRPASVNQNQRALKIGSAPVKVQQPVVGNPMISFPIQRTSLRRIGSGNTPSKLCLSRDKNERLSKSVRVLTPRINTDLTDETDDMFD